MNAISNIRIDMTGIAYECFGTVRANSDAFPNRASHNPRQPRGKNISRESPEQIINNILFLYTRNLYY